VVSGLEISPRRLRARAEEKVENILQTLGKLSGDINLIFFDRRTDAAYLSSSRDKASFDVLWLRDKASKNPTISPLTLSQEIVQHL